MSDLPPYLARAGACLPQNQNDYRLRLVTMSPTYSVLRGNAEIKLKGEITTTGWPGCSTNLGQSVATVRDWDCAASAGLKDKGGF